MARRGRRRAESRCNRSSGCGGEQVSSGLERSDRKRRKMVRRGRRRAESRCNRGSRVWRGAGVSSGLERSDRKNDGGQGRNRTADASLFRAALYQLSYLASFAGFTRKLSVGPDKTCAVWNVLDYNNQTGIAQMSVSICKDSVEQCPFVLAPSSFRLSPLRSEERR